MNEFIHSLSYYALIEDIPFLLEFGLLLFLVGSCVLYVLAKLGKPSLSFTQSVKVSALVAVANLVVTFVLFDIIEFNSFSILGSQGLGDWTAPLILIALLVAIGSYVLHLRGVHWLRAVLLSFFGILLTYAIGFVVLYSPIVQSWLPIG